MEGVAEARPQELRLRMATGAQGGELLRRVTLLEQRRDLRVQALVGRAVVLRLQVQHQDVLALLGVEAGPGLGTQRALLHQARKPLRRLEVLVPRVLGQRVGHGLDDVRHGVQPDHVGRAVGRRLRPADRRAGQRIDGVEAQAELRGVVHRRQHREHADAVADEVGGVAGIDHALAQGGGQEGLQSLHHRVVGAAGGDQLGQVHVPRRVEEVHAAEARAHLPGQHLGQLVDAQAGGVAGQDRVRRHVRGDLPVQVLLPVHALGDGLDHQVAAFQQFQAGFVVGRGDARGQRLLGQWRRLELAEPCDRLLDDAVRLAFLCREVEQHGIDACVDQVRGDLRPHDACAQDRGTAYKQFLGHLVAPCRRDLKGLRDSALEAGGREADQLARGALAVFVLADPFWTLDQAEVGHGVGKRSGEEVQPPVQLLLVQVRQAGGHGAGELAQDVAVLLGQETAQVVVLLGVGAGDHAHEGAAAAPVGGDRKGRLDERGEDRLQLARVFRQRRPQHLQPVRAHLVHPAAEHLVDEVLLAPEVVVDRGDVDLGAAGHLAQRGAAEAVLGEQLLGGAEEPVLGGERGRVHAERGSGRSNQTIV